MSKTSKPKSPPQAIPSAIPSAISKVSMPMLFVSLPASQQQWPAPVRHSWHSGRNVPFGSMMSMANRCLWEAYHPLHHGKGGKAVPRNNVQVSFNKTRLKKCESWSKKLRSLHLGFFTLCMQTLQTHEYGNIPTGGNTLSLDTFGVTN